MLEIFGYHRPATEPKKTRGRGYIFYGWFVVVGLIFISLVSSASRYGWGTFSGLMLATVKITRAEIGGAATTHMVIYAFMSLVTGRLIDTLGARLTMTIGGFFLLLPLVMLSFTSALWWVYLWYGFFLAIGVNLTFFIPVVATARKWFIKRGGTAASLSVFGSGLGASVIPLGIGVFGAALGWQTAYWVCGLAFGIVAMGCAYFVVRNKPEDMGLLPDGVRPEQVKADGGHMVVDPSTRADGGNPAAKAAAPTLEVMWGVWEALRTWPIWALFIGYGAYNVGLQGLLTHAPLWGLDTGLARALIGMMSLCLSGAAAIARLVGGPVADATSRKWNLAGVQVLCAISFLVAGLIHIRTPELLVIFLLLYGWFYGWAVALWAPVTGDVYGRLNVGTLFGIVTLGAGLVGGQGGVIFGMLRDASGNYDSAALVGFACHLVAAVCVASVFRQKKKAKA